MVHMIGIGAKITPAGEFTPEQRFFLSLEREKGTKYSELCKLLKTKWSNKEPLVFHQSQVSNSWHITDIVFLWWMVVVLGGLQSVYSVQYEKRALKVVAEEGGAFEGKHMRI